MSSDDADDDSPDRDRRFDDMSVTAEGATTADEATEPDDDAVTSDEDIDAWEWNDPEPTAQPASGSDSPQETDHGETRPPDRDDPRGSERKGDDADPSPADTPEGNGDDSRSHGHSTDALGSTRDSGRRRTGSRIWNRSSSNQADDETAETPSAEAPTEPEVGPPASESSKSVSTPAEDSAPNPGDSTPSPDAVRASDAATDASDGTPDRNDATPDETAPADTGDNPAFSPGAAGGDSDAESPTAGLDPAPGTSILLQCGSQDDREDAACHDLLGLERAGTDRNALLIQYRRLTPDRLEHIADHAARTTVVAVGYSQPVPESVADSVDTIEINNPNDITRLGILVSGTLDDWADHDATTVVCYDSVNVLLEYKDVQSTFRFFHVFLGTLESADAIAHFHADPLAGTPQKINTLKPLFDEVVSIDSMGVSLE